MRLIFTLLALCMLVFSAPAQAQPPDAVKSCPRCAKAKSAKCDCAKAKCDCARCGKGATCDCPQHKDCPRHKK